MLPYTLLTRKQEACIMAWQKTLFVQAVKLAVCIDNLLCMGELEWILK